MTSGSNDDFRESRSETWRSAGASFPTRRRTTGRRLRPIRFVRIATVATSSQNSSEHILPQCPDRTLAADGVADGRGVSVGETALEVAMGGVVGVGMGVMDAVGVGDGICAATMAVTSVPDSDTTAASRPHAVTNIASVNITMAGTDAYLDRALKWDVPSEKLSLEFRLY